MKDQTQKATSSEAPKTSIGQRLRQARLRLNLSQEALAEAIGTSARSIRRWERDQAIPHLHYRELLCQVFKTNATILFGIVAAEQEPSPAPTLIWHVPHLRNPYFTGREEVLTTLFDMLKAPASSPILALNGLPGIGKTQTAVEFAYRFRDQYWAVLWIGAETRDLLRADLVTLAHTLNLPEKQEQDQERIIAAVKRWLHEQKDWLLILDNVEDLTVVSAVVGLRWSGTILLTTRAQATGTFAHRFSINQMEQDEGALFLLRRAKLLAPNAHLQNIGEKLRTGANKLTQLMDGLPLALDQAGAYIEETGCTLSDYITLYQKRQSTLLNRRGGVSADHPESVTTMFSLIMERLVQTNPAAAELLRLYAFLHPEGIPEELLSEAASTLDPPLELLGRDILALNGALGELRRFSLVQRDPQNNTLSLHRLVQTVIKESMERQEQHGWAQRCVRIVNQAFPHPQEPGVSWLRRLRYLVQAQQCAELIAEWNMQSPEAVQLLDKIGIYFLEFAQYDRARDYSQRALHIAEKIFGPEHPIVAECISVLGVLAQYQKQFVEAEHLYQRTLDIRRRTLGEEHIDIAESLNNLASIYSEQSRYAEAEPLYQKALYIQRKELGSEHFYVAITMANLTKVYRNQQRYHEAEEAGQQALDVMQRTVGSDHPYYADQLIGLASTYLCQNKYEEAEPLLQQALTQPLGEQSPRLLQTLTLYVTLLEAQEREPEAQPLRKRIARIQGNANKA